jgi:putative hemolysin
MLSLLILLLLIVLNGIFAMSEIAVLSASDGKLEEDAEGGSAPAAMALSLRDEPNRFLSTVQVGITLVGVTSGAFGGQTLARDLAELIRDNLPFLAQFAEELGNIAIVGLTTYLTLVIGELVPKRIALHDPERMSKLIAVPMNWLATLTAPLVFVLSHSTEFVAGLLGVKGDSEDSFSDYEIISMMRRGTAQGEFEEDEHRMVKGALELDDKLLREILTPRTEIVWLDITSSTDEIRRTLAETTYTAYPVCRDGLDNVIGILRSKDLLTQLLNDDPVNIPNLLREPIYAPEMVRVSDVLKRFRKTTTNVALVVGEYGGIEGMVTLTDLVEEVFGEVDVEEPGAIQRDDGSWLLDAQMSVSYVDGMLPDLTLPEHERPDYATLGGFVMTRLGRIPREGDSFEWHGYRFEVMDMDGKRVDKMLVSRADEDTQEIVPPHQVDIGENELARQDDSTPDDDPPDDNDAQA